MNTRPPQTHRRIPVVLRRRAAANRRLPFDIHDLAAIVLIAAFVLLFFWRVITPRLEDRAVFPPGDFTDQFWAFRMYEARAFAAGQLPLWSENFNSGHPFLADVQSAIFYPVSLIWTLAIATLRGASFTLLDLEVEAIFHFILAGAFTYLFARRLIGSRGAALISALTFTFGGYLTSYPPQQLAILETATWLPLALLFLDLAIERGQTWTSADAARVIASTFASLSVNSAKQSPPRELGIASSRSFDSASLRSGSLLAMTRSARYYIAAGVVLGIAALAGHPQTFLFVAYACVIYFVWRVASQSQKSKAPSQKSNHISRFAFYLLPFAFSLVVAVGISAAQWIPTLEYQMVSTRAAISWADAASGFPTLDPLQMILPGFVSAFQSPLYIGILPLWLAIFALFVNRSREKIFWAALVLGSLLVSFGFYVFAYALFYLFAPGFALFRGQERLALVVSFSLAMLAGYGWRDLMQPVLDEKRARRAWALLPAGVTISILMVLTLYISGTLRQSGRVAFLGDRAALMALLFVLASVLVAALITPSPVLRGRGWGGGLALALIAFDLFSINTAAYNATSQERYPITPIVQTIQNDRSVFRVVDEGKMPGHFGIAYNLEEIGGISPLRISHYDTLLDNLPEEKLWQLLNVRYAITGRPGFANAEVVAQDGETRLLRLQNEMPRAWLVGTAQMADDRAALAAMASDSFDPRAVAYVSGPLPFPLVTNAAFTPVKFETRDPEHLVMTLNTPTDQLLVLSEVYYPGWRATVDGVSTPILRADVALRAVPLRAGTHRVELVFDPGSVKIGIAVTVATMVAVMVGALLGWHKSDAP